MFIVRLLIHVSKLVKDAHLLLGVFLFAIFLVESQQLQLVLVDVTVVYHFIIFIVNGKLLGYQLCIFNIEVLYH